MVSLIIDEADPDPACFEIGLHGYADVRHKATNDHPDRIMFNDC